MLKENSFPFSMWQSNNKKARPVNNSHQASNACNVSKSKKERTWTLVLNVPSHSIKSNKRLFQFTQNQFY